MATLEEIQSIKTDTIAAIQSQKNAEIKKGSDEHLDMILVVKKPLDNLNDKLAIFNNELVGCITPDNNFNKEYVDSLKELLEFTDRLSKRILSSKLKSDISGCAEKFEAEVEQLRESIEDIELLSSKDDELTILFNSL